MTTSDEIVAAMTLRSMNEALVNMRELMPKMSALGAWQRERFVTLAVELHGRSEDVMLLANNLARPRLEG